MIPMLLCLEKDFDITYLKWMARHQHGNIKFPRAAAEKFQEILHNDEIQPEEFKKELWFILKSLDTWHWKLVLFFDTFKKKFLDQINQISLLQFCLIFSLFLFLFFSSQIFKSLSKKRRKTILKFCGNILLRFFALLGYFVPLLSVSRDYLAFLVLRFPFLQILLNWSFFETAVEWYAHTRYIGYIYFFGVLYVCINCQFPPPRIIRFHFIRGLLLNTAGNVPALLYDILSYQQLGESGGINEQMFFCTFLFQFYFFVPAMIEAITLSYPRRKFVRDAVEIILGRDYEGFIWWDREK